MKSFITVTGESTAEYSEKRSRFIATLRHISSEAEAAEFLAEMRTRYWDARHNCYAYSLKDGNLKRFSDDSEPHGTAGKPILDVIEGSGVTDVMIVVTRYFGGVLLGTGGLVKAYSTSARDAMLAAERVKMTPCTVYKTVADYSLHERLVKLIEQSGGTVENTEFTSKVAVTYFMENIYTEDFLLKLREGFAARLSAEEIEQNLRPVKIN